MQLDVFNPSHGYRELMPLFTPEVMSKGVAELLSAVMRMNGDGDRNINRVRNEETDYWSRFITIKDNITLAYLLAIGDQVIHQQPNGKQTSTPSLKSLIITGFPYSRETAQAWTEFSTTPVGQALEEAYLLNVRLDPSQGRLVTFNGRIVTEQRENLQVVLDEFVKGAGNMGLKRFYVDGFLFTLRK